MNQLTHIQSKIYELRGQRVMLDRDLAEMYGIETKVLKQAVKRNIRRFPSDFMFELSREEFDSLRSQIVTSNQRGGTRYMPYVFSEQGVAMLSSVLNSEVAIEVNINIMRAFVYVRQLVLNPKSDSLELRMKNIEECLNDILADQNDINEDTRMQLELINETLAELQADKTIENTPRNSLGFKIGE